MADAEEKTMSLREQIMWYIERIVDRLTESQAQTILSMLNRFYLGKRE